MPKTASERFYTAISGGTADRVPTLPKIWVDLGANLTGTELREVVESAETAMEVVVDAALSVGADGARLFHLPNRKTKLENGVVCEVDEKGEVFGPVDMQGGLATRVRNKNKIHLEQPYYAAMIQFYRTDEPLVESIDDVKRIAVPEKSFYEQIGFGRLQRRMMEKAGDELALIGDCGSATLAFHVLFRNLSLALMDLLENPKLTCALMDKGVAHAVEKGKFHIDCGLRILRLNDSIANMSVISPKHFREYIKPRIKAVCDELHRYEPSVRIYCHICGNVMPIIEDLIETGLDCIGPLDPLGGFSCAEARNVSGNRVALMGGVNTLSFINAMPEQLIEEAKTCIEGAGKAGYILGSGCVVPRNTRRENLLALREASFGIARSRRAIRLVRPLSSILFNLPAGSRFKLQLTVRDYRANGNDKNYYRGGIRVNKVKLVFILTMLFVSPRLPARESTAGELDRYNVIWTSQSRDSSESMPVGGSDVGLNVWVENDELLFYIGRSGTFDENNQMLKLGRVRISLEPNPFEKGQFRQELKLSGGFIEVSGKNAKAGTKIRIWVEVYRPVVHIEIEADKPVDVIAQYENWRTAARVLPGDCRRTRFPCMSLVGYPGKVIMHPDHIEFRDDAVLWYHRNDNNDLLFDKEIKQQHLEQVKELIWNPLKNRTFGGLLKGENMVAAGTVCGRYAYTNFKGFRLRSRAPVTRQNLTIYLHTEQADTIVQWLGGLERLIQQADSSLEASWQEHQNWWQHFWQRGHVFINADKNDPEDAGWQVGRNYQLYRYMQGCNAYGKWPTKFNGSFFTYDPAFVHSRRGVRTETPDYRAWGGGSFTAQNQRLVYWPMLKNGDFDMMPAQFEFYRRALKAAELRTKVYWGHNGCSFTEQLENFGLPCGSIYGWLGSNCRWGRRQPGTPIGTQALGCVYQFGHQLDFSFMILEYFRYSGRDISAYLPFIDSSVTFFDEHYQYLEKQRSGRGLDENGHLVIYPSRGAESYVDAHNPADVIAGLKAVLSRLIELPENYVSQVQKRRYKQMLERVPPLPIKEKDGHPYLAGAKSWKKFQVGEIPELYSVFPYGLFNLEENNLQIARYTWTHCLRERQKNKKEPWYQGGIFAARLGFTEYAKELAIFKLGPTGQRFPAFRDSDDWAPDHNWLGVGMIGLQEMLMQSTGRKIYLLPAWPKEWNVDFKLYAPYQTTVEVVYEDGQFRKLKVTPQSRRADVIVVK